MTRSLIKGGFFPVSLSVLALILIAAVAMMIAACSSTTATSGTGGGSGMAQVNVRISDPATCQAPGGPFAHVYVTIKAVKAHVSATAGDNDSGWVDLAPSLAMTPLQVDLLGQANNQCFLASLGDAQQLQPGSYQQIRIILAPDTASLPNTACGASANCVVLAADSSVHALQLSSESKTGIKIPSGQIASGAFTVGAGQTKDLDIDFITCQSILRQGNGQYRLKPVLHAGEVSTTSTSINGKVLDGVTGNPVSGTVVVAVEQKDTAGIDRIQRATLAAADGTFVFCPLPAGTYDVVVVGTRTDGAIYEPSIITGVSVGSATGTVDLFALASPVLSLSTVNGTVTSQTAANSGTVADVEIGVLETLNSTTFTIPLPPTPAQSSATLVLETAAPGGGLTCPSNTDCAHYSIAVSSAAANVGAWSSGGTPLTPNVTLATYTIEAQASVPSSGGTADCSPSDQSTSPFTLSAGGTTITADTLAFAVCQ
jgi:hypothetical protein